jgi:hypothetical protein
VKREGALVRLLSIYWKVASLLLIADLLLTDRRPIGFVLLVLAPVLVLVSLWFWVDLNEEIADLPPWRPLPLTLRIWRWGTSFWAVIAAALSVTALACMDGARMDTPRCALWLRPPYELHQHLETGFGCVDASCGRLHWLRGAAGLCGGTAAVAAGAPAQARPGGR